MEVRRAGQKSLYRSVSQPEDPGILREMLRRVAPEIPAAVTDDQGLALILRKRKDKLRSHFDELAGRFGKNYVPGRSWKAIAEMLFKLLPPLAIADIGAGEATFALMLAQRAEACYRHRQLGKMVEYGSGLGGVRAWRTSNTG